MRAALVAAFLVVAVGGIGWWASFEAGRPGSPVVAPTGTPLDGTVKKFTELMAAEPPVVLLGSAAARSGIQARTLTAELGGAKVAGLTTSRSGAASWIVFLEHRVFAAGHRPALVIVADVPWNMLLGGPEGPNRTKRLLDHLPESQREVPLGEAVQRSPAESRIPGMLSLAGNYGSKILFVELPTAPSARAVSEADRAALAELVRAEEHAGYLDLSGVDIGADGFTEAHVYTADARTQLTAALVARLSPGVLDGTAPLPKQ